MAWHAGMFGRYLSIHSGGISCSPSAPHIGHVRPDPVGLQGRLACWPGEVVEFGGTHDGGELDADPLGGTLPLASPASCMANWQPITPNSTVRAIALSVRRYDFSMSALAAKSRTSPAMWEGSADGSKRVMV